jgi:ribosomal-protein-alanine N-acetyltransferase
MSGTITIRPYTQEDQTALILLLRLNTPEYFATSEEEDFLYYLNNHAANHYVLEVDGQILGCGGFNFSDDLTVGKISWDILHPHHQEKGLGRRLTLYRIEKMREVPSVCTISVRTSQLVYKFYEKLGFELKETAKDYWAAGFDMYRMEQPVLVN